MAPMATAKAAVSSTTRTASSSRSGVVGIAEQVETAKTGSTGPGGRHRCRSDSAAARPAHSAVSGMPSQARAGLSATSAPEIVAADMIAP